MKDIVKLNKLIAELEKDYDSLEETSGSKILDRIKALSENLYLRQVKKIAQESKASGPKKVDIPIQSALELLGVLKMNLSYMQTAHWVSKGKSSYGDHLLYERIYGELATEIDAYAEKVLALTSDEVVSPAEVLKVAAERISKVIKFTGKEDGKELALNAINSEKYVLAELERFYNSLKEKENVTMGLDDLLMQMHSSHETNVYLLQQRAKE